jgi:hypothetical protein
MTRLFLAIGLVGGLSVAQATVSVVTWDFSGNPAQVAQGSAYTQSQGTITVYGEQYLSSSTSNPFSASGVNNTLNGLFRVNDSVNSNGKGIAPFNPSEGVGNISLPNAPGGDMSGQDGIEDVVTNATNYSNILLLKLTNFTQPTTLSLLLQAGVTGDTFTVWTSTGSQPASLGAMSMFDAVPYSVDESGNSQPSMPQVNNLAVAAGVTTWLGIQADCHYLLLDTITGTQGSGGQGTPEPRFYGLLLVSLLAIPAIRRRFVTEQ